MVEVTWEDQKKINQFGRLNTTLTELKIELQEKKVSFLHTHKIIQMFYVCCLFFVVVFLFVLRCCCCRLLLFVVVC